MFECNYLNSVWLEIKGKVNTAICYARNIEEGAAEQSRRVLGYPFTEGSRIRIMPINMRDRSVLAVEKGNPEWNYSAPHGAGRILSRTEAKEKLNMDEYRREMAGIYITSVNEKTLDEAPMA